MIIERSLAIHAPVEAIYRISQDYAVRYEWDPFPEQILPIGNDWQLVPGAKVLVVAKSGMRMEVEFVQLAAPCVAAVAMTKGPAFLDKFAGSWTFRAIGQGTTQAKFRYSIKVKAWAIPVLAEKIAAIYFGRVVEARLHGLKRYCEAVCR